MTKGKVVLIYNSVKFFENHIEKKGIKVFPIYKSTNLLLKFIRKLFTLLGINTLFWFGEWRKYLTKNKVKTVILFANDEVEVWNYLNKIKNIKIIFWYWNPTKIYKRGLPFNLPKQFIPYSFDPIDCSNFNIRFNSTFYFDTISIPDNPIIFDVLFVGLNKGRANMLASFSNEVKKLSLNNYIYLVGDKNRFGKHVGNQPISYQDYLLLLSKSKAILDLIQDKQSGLTLRAMESIFFNKKLITNDKSIVNQMFYKKENVFVIGIDEMKSICDFLILPYSPLSKDIIDYYDVSNWVQRFEE